MSQLNNPFIRGYHNLRVVRQLLITYEDDCPPVWRSVHPTQAHLAEDQVNQFPCVFDNYFALITEGQKVPRTLEDQYKTEGIVRSVVYAVSGQEFDGTPVHVGDLYSEEAARQVVRRLSFETGFYSRAWEISTDHITEDSMRHLCEWVDIDTRPGLLFVAFRVPYSPVVGVKLIATPWSDENLQDVEGITAHQLQQEHLSKGIPEDLTHILQLAASADVRILMFDADAPVLDGLPIYAR